MIPRYDEQREVYRDCRFCGGKGCLACPSEADSAYRAAFPEGPKPIATIKIEEIGQLKDILGPDGIRRYFGHEDLGEAAFERDLTARLAEIRGASGIETEGHDPAEGHGAKHESPTAKGRDAPDA